MTNAAHNPPNAATGDDGATDDGATHTPTTGAATGDDGARRKDARACYRDAFAHYVAGRVDEAIAGYRRALEHDAALAIAWNGLAMALERAGDLPAAVAAAERLLALTPDDVLAHTSLSRIYQKQGRIPEAEAEQAKAARLQHAQS